MPMISSVDGHDDDRGTLRMALLPAARRTESLPTARQVDSKVVTKPIGDQLTRRRLCRRRTGDIPAVIQAGGLAMVA
jgi:hypothetical protein